MAMVFVLLVPRILIWCNVVNKWVVFVRYAGYSITPTIPLYAMVLYPKKLSEQQTGMHVEKDNDGTSKIRMDSLNSQSITIASVTQQQPMTWRRVVCSYTGFELFIDHLATEFSTENLLFIQEVGCIGVYVLLCFLLCVVVGEWSDVCSLSCN